MKSVLFDTYDFAKIIQGGNIYVDKTALLHRLVASQCGSRFFISRPRRFGKSLMISTLEYIFNARRDLFVDLDISKMDYAWPKVPVVHFDMSSVLASNIEELKKNIVGMIRLQASLHDVAVDFSAFDTPSSCLNAYLNELVRKYNAPLAILVDEYDAPVNRLVEEGASRSEVSSILHDFYMQLKVNDAHIRFLMMTGVSKFARLSVFSGLNNLKDLTLEAEYAGLFGYTPEEISHYFSENIDAFAAETGRTSAEVFSLLLEWYDGYRFSPYSSVRVTNPVSLAASLEKRRFDPFWDETGTSTLIYKHLKNRLIAPAQLNGFIADKADLGFCDISNSKSPALLFQTGYLTIDKVLSDGKLQFKIPNKEVLQALTSGMLSFIFKGGKRRLLDGLDSARDQLKSDPARLETVLNETLTAAFKAIPYDWKVKDEPEARRMFLFYCYLMGADISGEVHSSKGRADAVLEFPDSVFIFEFKYNHTAEAALTQAEEKDYGGPFANGKRRVFLIGVNYNPEKRNIDSPCCKELQRGPDGLWTPGKLITESMGASGEIAPYIDDSESSSESSADDGQEASLSAETTGRVMGA